MVDVVALDGVRARLACIVLIDSEVSLDGPAALLDPTFEVAKGLDLN